MWQRFQQMFRRPIAWIPSILAGLLNLATWVLLLINVKPANDVVLHYTLSFGVDWVGTWIQALYIPALGLTLLVMNVVIAFLFWQRQKFYSHFFLLLTPIFELFLFSAAIFLIIANLPARI